VAATGDARVRWFDLPKAPGFGYANRNRVLAEARGEIVAHFAHDDLWLPDHLERLVGALDAEGADWVSSRPLWVTPEGLLVPVEFDLYEPATLEAFLARRRSAIPACCVAHRRACLDRVGALDAALPASADLDLWARILEDGGRKRFAFVPEPTSLHFRAPWRTDAGPAELREWVAWLVRYAPAPAALRVAVPPGRTEQEVVFERLAADPDGFTRALRSAVAWVMGARLAALRQAHRDQGRALAEAQRERDQALRRLARLRASRAVRWSQALARWRRR
jgi:hypothetical protein